MKAAIEEKRRLAEILEENKRKIEEQQRKVQEEKARSDRDAVS